MATVRERASGRGCGRGTGRPGRWPLLLSGLPADPTRLWADGEGGDGPGA